MMDQFIFHSELESELQWMLDHPLKIPSPLCFYGEPGIGKTSFSKYLSDRVSKETVYHDCNSYLGNEKSSSQILSGINKRTFSPIIVDENRKDNPWTRSIILDEWHNFTNRTQDSYKIPFEQLSEKNGCLFILCVNTNVGKKKSIHDVLTPAIKSRCHLVRFNILVRQKEEMVERTLKRYPMLDERFVRQTLPDFRKINRRVQMMTP